MSGNGYGNMGNEMKAMADDRASLRAETKVNTERFVAEAGKAREEMAAQTRRMLAQAQGELKARTRQTLAEADELAAAIRKDVAALKADAGRILSDANGFLSQTGSDNAKLRDETHKMLAGVKAECKAQARKIKAQNRKAMAQTREAVAGLRTEAARILADAAGVMQRLCTSSRQRAAGWREVLRMVHGNGRGAPAVAPVAGEAMELPARTKPKGKKRASAKKD